MDKFAKNYGDIDWSSWDGQKPDWNDHRREFDNDVLPSLAAGQGIVERIAKPPRGVVIDVTREASHGGLSTLRPKSS